ncbi:hypothetical protein, partial [Escherichia coli]|uniref:hypothetical protein n=1 Tax=Escherichia coli TaxID=562 RepID=UPI001952B4AB
NNWSSIALAMGSVDFLIEVKDSSGKQVETGKTSVSKKNNHMVEASLPADLKADVYSVSLE